MLAEIQYLFRTQNTKTRIIAEIQQTKNKSIPNETTCPELLKKHKLANQLLATCYVSMTVLNYFIR